MTQTELSIINQLTVASLAVVACITLWRAFQNERAEHIKDLRDFINNQYGDLKTRIMLIEDRLGMPQIKRDVYSSIKSFSDEPDKIAK